MKRYSYAATPHKDRRLARRLQLLTYIAAFAFVSVLSYGIANAF